MKLAAHAPHGSDLPHDRLAPAEHQPTQDIVERLRVKGTVDGQTLGII
jgi:hypothetical protein